MNGRCVPFGEERRCLFRAAYGFKPGQLASEARTLNIRTGRSANRQDNEAVEGEFTSQAMTSPAPSTMEHLRTSRPSQRQSGRRRAGRRCRSGGMP